MLNNRTTEAGQQRSYANAARRRCQEEEGFRFQVSGVRIKNSYQNRQCIAFLNHLDNSLHPYISILTSQSLHLNPYISILTSQSLHLNPYISILTSLHPYILTSLHPYILTSLLHSPAIILPLS